MTPSSPILSVQNLRKSFGGVRAVDDVSFDISAGELLALIGWTHFPNHRHVRLNDGD